MLQQQSELENIRHVGNWTERSAKGSDCGTAKHSRPQKFLPDGKSHGTDLPLNKEKLTRKRSA
jgi:hypothetical protein